MSFLRPFGIKKNPLALLIALALLTTIFNLAARHPQAQAQETFTITGRVINGTEGASAPQGIPVLLLVTGSDSRLIATGQTSTSSDGRFEFQQVAMAEDGVYAFSVDYAQVFYGATLSLSELFDDVELTVYETTQDASVVRVTNQVMVIGDIDEKNRTISAIEFVRLSNVGDRTLLPDLNSQGQLSFLRFALPPLADELDVGSDLPGGDIVSIGTGFALTSPVLPGNHFVDFSFRFPYQGEDFSYRQSLPQGADVYRVMVPQRLSTVGVGALQPVSSVNQQGATYRAWEGYDYEPGQGLSVRLTGLPQPSLGARLEKSITGGDLWKVAIPSALGAALAVLLLLGALRPRWKAETSQGPAIGSTGSAPADREAAVREIAALDQRFQQGDMVEEDYTAEREALVDRALGHSESHGHDQQGNEEVPTDEQP